MSTYVGLQNSFEQLMWCPLFSGGSRQGVWGAKKRCAKKVFACLNTRVCMRQSSGVTQMWLPFVDQKVAIFLGRTMRFFRE